MTVALLGPYYLSALGIIGVWQLGSKRRWSFLFLIFVKTQWMAFAIYTGQYGFLLSAVVFSFVFLKNWVQWRRDDALAAAAE